MTDLQIALRDFDLVTLGESDGLFSGQRAQQIWDLLLHILPRRNANLHKSSQFVLTECVKLLNLNKGSNANLKLDSITIICREFEQWVQVAHSQSCYFIAARLAICRIGQRNTN